MAQHTASSGGGNDQEDSRCMNWSGGNSLQGKHNRTCASKFRKQSEYKHVIKLIDVDGSITKVRSRGQFNITGHNTVLQIFTNRAKKYHQVDVNRSEDPGHSWSLDETGTLEISQQHMSSEYEIQQQEISEINMVEVLKEVLKVHGHAPPTKADGTVRLIYKNVNGFCNRLSGNKKVERAREIHNKLEADIASYCEHRLNMHHKKNCNGFN
jgi:hypothetical protein